jgi:hypothetical protein
MIHIMQMEVLNVVVLMPPKRQNDGDSNVISLNASSLSHGVTQVRMHSQVASQGTGVFSVNNADKSMYYLHLLGLVEPWCVQGLLSTQQK